MQFPDFIAFFALLPFAFRTKKRSGGKDEEIEEGGRKYGRRTTAAWPALGRQAAVQAGRATAQLSRSIWKG